MNKKFRRNRNILLQWAIFIAVSFLCYRACSAQTVGFNAEGFQGKYEPAADDALITFIVDTATFVGCEPGGAEAKLCDPAFDKPGWGMSMEIINNFYNQFPKDENGEGIEKDQKKYQLDIKESRSFLFGLQDEQRKYPNKLTIWKLNILLTPAENVRIISDLKLAGVKIVGISLGNEFYFVLKDFPDPGAKYISMIDPHVIALHNAFPEIDLYLNFGQDTRAQRNFNDDVITYYNSHKEIIAGFDTHPYATPLLLSADKLNPAYVSEKVTTTIVYQGNTENRALTESFTEFNRILNTSTYWDDIYTYIETNAPGAIIIQSELGAGPVNLYGNTLAHAAWLMKNLLKYKSKVLYSMVHNFLGGYYWAAIYDHMLHTSAYAVKFALECKSENYITTDNLTFESAGTFYFPYENFSDDKIISLYAFGFDVQIENTFLDGKYIYSSLGETGHYNKGTQYLIDDVIYDKTEDLVLRQNSFGYLKITVIEIPKTAPVVNAGPNITVTTGETFTLRATATDAENDITSYLWYRNGDYFNSGLEINIYTTRAETSTFTFKACDASGLCASDDIIVTVTVPCRKKFMWMCLKSSKKCNC